MKRWLGLLLTLTALLALAACSGGDDSDDATATATASPTPATAEPTATDDSQSFADALTRLDSGSYRISYDFTTTTAGQDFSGTLTWVRAQDGRARFETTATQAGQTVTLIVIVAVDGTELLCMDIGAVGSCFSAENNPIGGSMPNPAELILEGLTDQARLPGVSRSGSETIIGIDTECYSYDGADGASKACISEQGFMLRAEWNSGGQSARLEATEFNDDVSDEDFEAPYPITG